MSDAKQRAKQISNNLQREQCYLVMMRPAQDPPEPPIALAEIRIQHHEYLIEMEKSGVLFAAGPLRDKQEPSSGHGLLIFRAKNREEAKEYAMQEPYTKYGQRSIQIIPWQRNEGTLMLNLRFADGVLEIDRRRWSINPEKKQI